MTIDLRQLEEDEVVHLSCKEAVGDSSITCKILKHSEDLVLLQLLEDFAEQGFSILRRDEIAAVRSGEYERAFERIMAAQPSNEDPLTDEEEELVRGLPLDGWRACFNALAATDTLISIEAESESPAEIRSAESDGGESVFLVGIVSESDGSSVWLLACDAFGHWESEELGLDLDRISRVDLMTPYLRRFLRYLSSRSAG